MKNDKKNAKNSRGGRSRPQKAKIGRLSIKEKILLEKKLHHQFDIDGITPWRASIECGCSYEYACKKFSEYGLILSEAEEETWIERNTKVRKRALEGLSIKILSSHKHEGMIEKRLEKSRDVQEQLMDTMVDNVKNTELGEVIEDSIGRCDGKVVLAIFKKLTNDINMWKNYGYLVEQIDKALQQERILGAELQQQYDGIEILPPPEAVLDREIEKAIAAKHELFKVKVPQPGMKT